MPPLSSLIQQLRADFKAYNFRTADTFKWTPADNTIYHPPLQSPEDIWSLMHEIAHAELKHRTYQLDIDLINCETSAWEHAASHIAPRYGAAINRDYIEDHLDTYRQWLHARSTCPECGQNGIQTQNTYRCINCRCLWRANEARMCALRRIKL